MGIAGYLFLGFQNQDKTWETYTNEEYRVQFDYPAEWEIYKKRPRQVFIYDPVAQTEYEEFAFGSVDEDDFDKFIELVIENIPGIAKSYAKSPSFVYVQDFLDNKISLEEFVYRETEWVRSSEQPQIPQETLDEYFKDSNLQITEQDGLTKVSFQRSRYGAAANTLVVITQELMAYYLDFDHGYSDRIQRSELNENTFKHVVDSFKIIK